MSKRKQVLSKKKRPLRASAASARPAPLPLDIPSLTDRSSQQCRPADLSAFWNARLDIAQWKPPLLEGMTPALKRLGPMPFARPGFPLMGLLATVYEQVTAHAMCVLKGRVDWNADGHQY